MKKKLYYRVNAGLGQKEIHIGEKRNEKSLLFKCGIIAEPLSSSLTICFRPNSLDAICRGCRDAWLT